MRPFPPRNWHLDFMSEPDKNRELNLIRFCVLNIDRSNPVAINGFNAYLVMQKMAEKLNDHESLLLQLLDLDLPDGQTVYDTFRTWLSQQRAVAASEMSVASPGIEPQELISQLGEWLYARRSSNMAAKADYPDGDSGGNQ